SSFVDALGCGDPRARRDGDDPADDTFDDVAPVRVHIEDDAATAQAIIPAWALAGPLAAVEHPPAEIEPEPDEASQLAAGHERGELAETRKMHLILHDAVFAPAVACLVQQRERLRSRRRHRLFAIDVLAGGDRLLENGHALLCRRRIEED